MREPKGLSLKDEEGEGEDFWEEFPDGAEVFLRTKENGNDENEEQDVEQHDVFRNIDEDEDMEENGESGSQGEVFQCDVCGKDFASQGNLSRPCKSMWDNSNAIAVQMHTRTKDN